MKGNALNDIAIRFLLLVMIPTDIRLLFCGFFFFFCISRLIFTKEQEGRDTKK